MPHHIPEAVTRYLASKGNPDKSRLADCFHSHASVLDEGQTFSGLEAIKAWQLAGELKYQYSLTPLGVSHIGDTVKLLARLKGNFPGEVADLMHVSRSRTTSSPPWTSAAPWNSKAAGRWSPAAPRALARQSPRN